LRRYIQGCAAVLAAMRLDPALGANAAIQAVGSAALTGVVAAFREVGSAVLAAPAAWQGLTLAHFSAQISRFSHTSPLPPV
jgi:hypothetical protein